MNKQKKRDVILGKAFQQWRKSRSLIDPAVIRKIREVIARHPKIMKALGVKKEDIRQQNDGEVIDQAKNMEILEKLMALRPDEKEKIQSAIKAAKD